jgi:hypothetical protein
MLLYLKFGAVFMAPFDGDFSEGIVAALVPVVGQAVLMYGIFETPKGAEPGTLRYVARVPGFCLCRLPYFSFSSRRNPSRSQQYFLLNCSRTFR